MKRRSLFLVCTALAACVHRVNLNGTDKSDIFRVDCAAATNCTNNTPAKIFTASGPAAGGILVARNGVILAENIDYTAAATANVVTVTFTSQPVADGDIIQLRYVAGEGR